MNIVWAICRRDLVAAFTTPLAWLVLACWTLLTNGMFARTLDVVHGTSGAELPLFVDAMHLGVFFLALLAPAVTMASFAAERVQGTMQLLLTVPIREHQLVLGKFLAAFLVLAALVAATLVQPLILLVISQVSVPHLLAGYLGLLLECVLFAALGVWISLLVDSPIAAYVLTFGAIAVLILVGIAARDSWLHGAGEAIGLGERLAPFLAGEVRLGAVAYFLAGGAGCLVLAHSALLARRING
jgi:ABC-2 type transport system permease protein